MNSDYVIVELNDLLYSASNIGTLEQGDSVSVCAADAIKADQALARLERLAYSSRDHARGATGPAQDVEELTLDPEMHMLRKMWALAQYASGNVSRCPVLGGGSSGNFRPASEESSLVTDEMSRQLTAKMDGVGRWAARCPSALFQQRDRPDSHPFQFDRGWVVACSRSTSEEGGASVVRWDAPGDVIRSRSAEEQLRTLRGLAGKTSTMQWLWTAVTEN